MKTQLPMAIPITIDETPFDPTITLSQFYLMYQQDVAPRLKVSTMECKNRLMKTYVLPYLGHVPMRDLSPQHIRCWQNKIISQYDFSSAYLNLMDRHFSSVLNYDSRFYDLPSPFDKTGHIPVQKRAIFSVWSVEEFETFIGEFQNDNMLKCLYEVLYWCGLRIGEALALTPEDVISNKKSLRINKAMTLSHGVDFVSTTKTKKANRIVAMPTFLYDELKFYIKHKNIKQKERLFDCSRAYVREHMVKACENTCVKKIRIHDLRHSHVSLLIQMGQSPVFIAERVGHEKVTTTLNTYSHLFPTQQQAIADALDRIHHIGNTPITVT